jgi:hypothetical protein
MSAALANRNIRRANKGPRTELEQALRFHLRVAGLPDPEWGWYWHPRRMYCSDAAYPLYHLLLEAEGGITPYRDKRTGQLRQGRHATILGYERDVEKYNAAALLGWHIIRFTRRMIDDGRATEVIKEALRVFR